MRLRKGRKALDFTKNDVEAAASAVTAMRTPYRGNIRSMAGNCQPVMDSGPDPAAFERRFSPPFMARDQKENPVLGCNCSLQRSVDRFPGQIKTMAVEIEHSVGLDPT